jgi:polyhydroxybutyrate depolymerase
MTTRIARSARLVVSLSILGCGSAPVESDSGPRVDTGVPTDTGPASDTGTTGGSDGGTTTGCGTPAAIATGEWVEQSIDVGGTPRVFFVHLPDGYDPARAYPVVHQFHGCSDSATREDNNVPVERESGSEAIHVRGRAAERCWDTAADHADMAFVDAMLAHVDASYCVDPGRRFVTGYSGGSFMAHRVACIRGSLLRGVATIAGGQPGNACTGDVAALLIHDHDDGTVNVSASESTRDAYLEANGCDATAPTTPFDPSPCVEYAGCDARLPVVWCETSMQDHSRQDGLAAPAFWGFLSSLPR